MPGRPKSNARKQQEHTALREEWLGKAVELYHVEQLKKKGDLTRMGLREVCKFVEGQCWDERKVKIQLDKMTLSRRLQGIHAHIHADQGWLTTEEEQTILDFTISHARMGWPLSRRRIEEHATLICHGRYGEHFEGIGKNWAKRFVQRHSDKLKGCWTRPLEASRARAGNPITKKAFFEILEETIKGGEGEDPIPAELIYGADESGFQDGIGTKEWAYGPVNEGILHQQRGGGRENITVMVTICADSTSIPPAVIFKGEGYQASWKQDNPLNASLGYSKKGYFDNKISVEWIKQFDKHTRDKAAGRRRLLLVDGHSSHYTREFLAYARENKIHVLCYPSHSTHLYQGLDVVIFGVMKTTWGRCRDEFELATGQFVDKSNFLGVYAAAHAKTLTKENILAAFKKTGIVPFDPNVITEEMLAPSLTTSIHGQLPLPMESPVRVMHDMLQRYLARQAMSTNEDKPGDNDGPMDVDLSPPSRLRTPFWSTPSTPSHTTPPSLHTPSTSSLVLPSIAPDLLSSPGPPTLPAGVTPIRVAVDELCSTSASFLVSTQTPKSTMQIPVYKPYTISPFRHRHGHLLEREPVTSREEELRNALEESERRDTYRKDQMAQMQAQVLLQGMYVGRVQKHLQKAEEKRSKKKSKRIVGDGMPRLMSGDDVFAMIEAADEQAAKEAQEKEKRKIAREGHGEVLAQWKEKEKERIARNKERHAAYHASVKAWEAGRALAKAEGRQAGWKKPQLKGIEKPIPRPKKPAKDESDDDEDDDGNEEEEVGEDE
ncbi:hypothetical protein Hypma_004386 [Hypsizygus marmoreus]|uniref:HTH CENPB-type domain-containing protein n=1 Tax=Hypsizygus marmoreus TaxID=39966 RepID=A0A369JXW3_HYPMA|nr:hypothetical protein Hypma_004386 [Hypsizygus marmoreus]